ncbi:hypothetical protein Tco_0178219 [Tanacetum coccineum]
MLKKLSQKEFVTHGTKMIEELFRKHMQNTTLNLYPTTSSSTTGNSSADLQHQLYLNMKSNPQDQAADSELWEILKAKFDKPSLFANHENIIGMPILLKGETHGKKIFWQKESFVNGRPIIPTMKLLSCFVKSNGLVFFRIAFLVQVLSDQYGQNDQTDNNDQDGHTTQLNEILNDDSLGHSDHNNDNPIIDKLTNTEDIQNPKLSSPAENNSVSSLGQLYSICTTSNLNDLIQALKPNHTKGPPFTAHMMAICNAEKPVAFKAPRTSSQTEMKVYQGTNPGA